MEFDPEAWRELPSQFDGGLTFHLPMIDAALELFGADDAARLANAEAEIADARDPFDPQYYRWAVDAYRDVAAGLLTDDAAVRAAAWRVIEPLGPGITGAAFHGVIRTAYAILRCDPTEVARGLAYTRVSHQVLAGPGEPPVSGGTGVVPTVAVLRGTSIRAQLNLLAGMPDAFDDATLRGPLPSPLIMAADAVSILHRSPGEFLTVHAVTSLHAVAEIHEHVAPGTLFGDLTTGPLQRWWRAWVVGVHLMRRALDISDPTPVEPVFARSFDEEVAAAIAGGEGHDIKLAYSLTRLIELGFITPADAASALAARVAASPRRV